MEKENIKEEPINKVNPENLTQDQALGVLIQGIRIAQKAGAFSLEDAEILSKAIKVFIPPKPVNESPDPSEK
jgi:hypothetical protein